METEQLDAMRDTARRFARREVAPLVGTEGRDGQLDQLDNVLARAQEAGLLASPDPESPGFEYGVWGRACLEEGDEASLAVLEELAVECAGVAACVHFAGLGALELAGADWQQGPVAVALFGQGWRAQWDAFQTPPSGTMKLGATGLSGAANFVYSPPETRWYAVYAAGESGWERALVEIDTAGVTLSEVHQRTGLAATRLTHLYLDAVAVPDNQRLVAATPRAFVRRLMLGLAAIAVGNARGAAREAQRYAEERYQGGRQIEAHPAVQLLVGDSQTRTAAAAAWLRHAAVVGDDDGAEAFWHGLAAKLRVTRDCGQAVTDSLQVLGGYGYMEEYRLEKRLRDAMTLEAMAIDPNTLRLLCAAFPGDAP